jgi:glucosylceramidase
LFIFTTALLLNIFCTGHRPSRIEGFTSTDHQRWYLNHTVVLSSFQAQDSVDLEILVTKKEQIIDGFGGCFNELGWQALQILAPADRAVVLKSLFSTDGCHFNLGRMPIGANDFAANWYSLNDSAGDYAMRHFNIERDRLHLIPYIKLAQMFRTDLKIWGSPWCPPAWMKKNGHYACAPSPGNDLDPNLPRRKNSATDFITDHQTQHAYASYFVKCLQACHAAGIPVYAVQVQNEPHSCQTFPSYLWRGPDLKNFILQYLGHAFENANLMTEIWYGTFERPYSGEWAAEIDGVLQDTVAMKYIHGFGFQWAGKDAIAEVHHRRPQLKLMHTETECGDGANTWEQAEYIYDLIRHYFDCGADAQMYWNMILSENPRSPSGWAQNSMLTINAGTQTVIYNPEF